MIIAPPAPPAPLRTTLTPLAASTWSAFAAAWTGSAFAVVAAEAADAALGPGGGSIRATAKGSPPRRQSTVLSSATAPVASASRPTATTIRAVRRGRASGACPRGSLTGSRTL
jgi:hypothetical protein